MSDQYAGGAPATDVSTELTALKADMRGLADSVQRLVSDAPGLARSGLEDQIRSDPMRSTFIAAGIGFVLAVMLAR